MTGAIEFDKVSYSAVLDGTRIAPEFLARHPELGARALRYEEAVIEEGEMIAVFGTGIREPDPAALPTDVYRGASPTRLRLTSTSRYPLLIGDHPETLGDS